MKSRPNILLIMTDQQYADMMRCTGTPWLQTPALDALTAGGVRFDRAYCTDPVCVPSRISMATGMMPCRLDAPENSSGMRATLPDRVANNSLGLLMKRAGYDTFYGGKVHMCSQLHPPGAGYDVIDKDERDALPDACAAFMTTERDAPFFAVASFINPHDICFAHNAKVDRMPQMDTVTRLYQQATQLPDDALPPLPMNYALPDVEPTGIGVRTETKPITPPGTMFQTYTDRDWRIYRWIYARLTEQVDREIGRILDALHDAGLDRHTLVVFTSDHGNMHANHRLASKSIFYEEAVRVPFIMRLPGAVSTGRVDATALVSTGLDILPTCCDYAGVEAPEGLHGISLRGVAEQTAGAPTHEFVVSEHLRGRMLRTARWKYTVYDGDEPREVLTDLEADPGEMHNLAVRPEHADVLHDHRRMMREWFELSGDEIGIRDFVVNSDQRRRRGSVQPAGR